MGAYTRIHIPRLATTNPLPLCLPCHGFQHPFSHSLPKVTTALPLTASSATWLLVPAWPIPGHTRCVFVCCIWCCSCVCVRGCGPRGGVLLAGAALAHRVRLSATGLHPSRHHLAAPDLHMPKLPCCCCPSPLLIYTGHGRRPACTAERRCCFQGVCGGRAAAGHLLVCSRHRWRLEGCAAAGAGGCAAAEETN